MKSTETRINCPYCEKNGKTPDRKRHLYINTFKRVYICFRCGEKGKARDVDEILIHTPINSFDALRSKLNKISALPKPIDIESFSSPITPNTLAYSYLLSRNVTKEEIEQYNLRLGLNVEWGGRILVPFYRNNICVYFVGRTYTHQIPKYKNCKAPKNGIMFNFENVKNECIITEGIFSALAAQRSTKIPAIALLGKYITMNQANLIASRCERVWVALDGDVESEERNNVIKMLYQAGIPNVLGIRLPKEHDPDSCKKFLLYFQAAMIEPRETKCTM